MSRLSLCEIAQSQLAATPIVDGQLVCCLDTGRFYRDTNTQRKELAAGLEAVTVLPLAPITQKLYLLKPGALYIYDEGWVRLNGAEDLIANKVDKADGKALSSNDFTDALLAKLNGIAAGANKYTHPAYTARSSGLYKVTVDGTGHISAAALAEKKDITDLGVPAQDTTYGAVTTSAAGLMSAADKVKLNGIAAGAQVNSITGVKGNAESSYRTGNVNITPANIGLGNVNNTADSAKSVASAAKLTTARNITLSGGAVGTAGFDGSKNISIAVTALDAAKLTGVVGIEHLPAGALERCVTVENDAARFALTVSDVQKGDTVKVESSKLMYFVVDDTKLDSAAGYLEYTAGAATSVPWSGVTGKPAAYAPAAHQHTIANITDLAAATVANARNATSAINATNAENATNDANGQAIAATYIKGLSVSGRNVTYTKGDGTTASFATQDTTYANMTGATASAAGKAGLAPAPGAGAATRYLRSDGTWAAPPNTTYTAGAGVALSGTVFSNSGVRSVTTGTANGTISVNTNGTAANVAVKGLGTAAYTAASAYAAAGHTHSYAGSATAGGAAASAVKLSTARAINGVNFDGTAAITVTANPTVTVLTGADLNTQKTPGFYYAGGGNTCTNKPSGVDAFGLAVLRVAYGYFRQELTAHNTGIVYFRTFGNDAWTAWGQMYSTANPQTSIVGNAATATALTTSAGSATRPVYFSGGKPVAGTYTLEKSVPSNAVFTDTNTWRGIQNNLTSDSTTDSLSAAQGKALKTLVDTKAGMTPASASAAGLMSAADKAKLDGVTASADAVSFARSLNSGTKLGAITINGTSTDLYCQTNTDTHFTTRLITGASATATANAAAGNGSVFLNVLDNTTIRDSHKIIGGGATTVTADANGVITVASTNTTYGAASASTAGLMSAADKAKLDGVTASADAVSFTRSLNSGTKMGTITINGTGTDLYCQTNTDTHYTTRLVTGNSATATANAAAGNGSVFLNVLDNALIRDSHKITGSGATTVTADANGVITVASTNTTYGAATGQTWGLVMLVDQITNIGASAGRAASPYSVKLAYDKAEAATSKVWELDVRIKGQWLETVHVPVYGGSGQTPVNVCLYRIPCPGMTRDTQLTDIQIADRWFDDAGAQQAMREWDYLETDTDQVTVYMPTTQRPSADFAIVAREVK